MEETEQCNSVPFRLQEVVQPHAQTSSMLGLSQWLHGSLCQLLSMHMCSVCLCCQTSFLYVLASLTFLHQHDMTDEIVTLQPAQLVTAMYIYCLHQYDLLPSRDCLQSCHNADQGCFALVPHTSHERNSRHIALFIGQNAESHLAVLHALLAGTQGQDAANVAEAWQHSCSAVCLGSAVQGCPVQHCMGWHDQHQTPLPAANRTPGDRSASRARYCR